MNIGSTIILNDGVQVRREKFGLLFYDYRGPRLYFVPSADLIEEQFFSGVDTVEQLISLVCRHNHSWPRMWVEKQIDRILQMLLEKGLIREQSLC